MQGGVYEISSMSDLETLVTEAKIKNKLLLVDCYAKWCGPCKAIAPFIAGLSVNQKFDCVIFSKADIEVAEDVANFLNVASMPSFYLFWNSAVVGTFTGANSDAIVELLEENKYLTE